MTNVLYLQRSLPKTCRYREFAPWQLASASLGASAQLSGALHLLEGWLDAQPQRQTRHNLQTLSLLKDSQLLYAAATWGLSRIADRLRWQQLGLGELSDRQLLVVIVNNLGEVGRGVVALRRQELALTGCRDEQLSQCLHNLMRATRRIEYLLDPAAGRVLSFQEFHHE